MSNWRILYWFLVGACFGFGVIAILSIGIFFLAAGLILLIFGAIRFGAGRLWAAIIGFGVAPAALLIWDVTSQPWACNPGGPGQTGVVSTQPGVNYFSCVNTFAGPLTTYHVMAAIFGAIAILGVIWGLAALWWGAAHRGGGGNGGPGHAAA